MSRKQEYRTFAEESRYKLSRKGSRFIGVGLACKSDPELKELRKGISEEFPDATHIASGSAVSEGGRIEERYDNDGEPSGTAGEPVLQVLRGRELLNAAIFVVRYFGGTELGTGGLVRAYSDAARGTIEAGSIETVKRREEYAVSFPYSFTGKVAEVLAEFGEVKVTDRSYGERPTLSLSVPVSLEKKLAGILRESTSGSAEISRRDEDKNEEDK